MRRFAITIFLLLLVGFVGYVMTNLPHATSVAPGDTAPALTLENTKGQKISLSDLQGKIVMINFWATWCPPCIEEMPSMQRLYDAMQGDDFVMLAINTEENGRSVVPEFLNKTSYTFPVLYDDQGEVQKKYGVYKFPETFIINKDGTIAQRIIGSLDWSSSKAIAYLKDLSKG
ncbi:Peroxiredoxin [Desulfuromusa kysingii]|uniref:Peroxiredoxin n=1 Tax=Desulfuromusa kysingii TaxID=37625 RepID=A0A1H4BKI7_9BACT|nr:TlpA disulfide reductase family protein [Desulfuromusa kysingii]SEA48564.1 Peroxiredoxin [Desulfuromusa kysingii]